MTATSEIGVRPTYSEERIPSESQFTTNAPLLEPLRRDERLVLNSEDSAHSAHETVQDLALGPERPTAPLLEKQSEAPQGWPISPQRVKDPLGTLVWNILVDSTLLALSVGFLAFALFVLAYNGKPRSSHQQAAERFEQTQTWGPTIYPILFASVVGRATHAILLWRLERGERVGTLDILAGSTSLTSTVVSQFHMRLVSYVGLGLIAIWMLSPVGGQSSFRQISFGPTNFVENAVFSHVVPDSGIWTPDVPYSKTIMDSLYIAGSISPMAVSGNPRDAWGNIKVPRIEYYEDTSNPGDEGWYKTENGTRPSYSSFIGIPIGGIDSAEFIDYSTTIEGMYFSLFCDPYLGELEFTFNQSTLLGDVFWNNYTIGHAELPPDGLKPFTFVFRREDVPALNCTAETAYVEVGVTCPSHTTCSASRVRRSRHEHPPTAYTRLGWFLGVGNTTDFSVNMSKPVESDESSKSDEPGINLFSSSWLAIPNNYTGTSELLSKYVAIRLTQALNAYWTTLYCKLSLMSRFNESTLPPDDKRIWSYQDESYRDNLSEEPYMYATAWPSTGTKRRNVAVFQAHYGWVIALIVSSTVLIIASLIPFYIRTFLSRGPDILMNLSSLATRDNPYIALPMTGTYLDGADRSRYLKDMRIRFGDVEEGSEVGRLVIGRLKGDIAPLKKGRKYV